MGFKEKEVRGLFRLYEAELGGEKPAAGAKSLRQMIVMSGGDGSFASLLKCLYPLAPPRELKQMLEWGAPKQDGTAEDSKQKQHVTEEQRREIHELFSFFDADGSGTIELEELQEAGWGTEGTADGDALREAFELIDTEGTGSLSLQQFEKLVVECSMLDDGLLGRAYVKQVKSTQVPEDAEPTPEQRRRSSDQQRLQRRPSLADISAAARMAVTKAYGSDEE